MYNLGLQIEFYLNRHELESRLEMVPLTRMPDTRPAWLEFILTRLGEILIAAGTQLKNSAHPQTVFSQETL
jgi:hypothetical protein